MTHVSAYFAYHIGQISLVVDDNLSRQQPITFRRLANPTTSRLRYIKPILITADPRIMLPSMPFPAR